jgi:hypothetical protein
MKPLLAVAVALCVLTSGAQSKDELKEKIDKLQLDLMNTQVKLLRANEGLTKAQQEIARLKEELAKAEPSVKKARELPLNVGRRKAVTGNGYVLEIRNASTKILPVKVTLISPTFSKTNTFDLVLDPAKITGPVKEIGHLEGWSGAPGDLVEIASDGFDPIRRHF